MNKYENIIIVNPNISEEDRKKLIEKITNLINLNGNVEKVEDLGKKKLAYEIRKNTEGYYYVFNLKGNSELISQLERIYRITEEIMKFIFVRIDEE